MTTVASPTFISQISDNTPSYVYPSPNVLLDQLCWNIEQSLLLSLTPIALINLQKVVTMTPSRKSRLFPTVNLRVIITPEDTPTIEALLDSGASATYISPTFVEDHHLPTRLLSTPIYAINADDTLNGTTITHQVKLTCHFQGHVSSEWFPVTNIGSKDMIISMTWLRTHNPKINWKTRQVNFTCVMNWHFSCSFRLIFLNTYDPYLSRTYLITPITLVSDYFTCLLCSQKRQKCVY